MVTPQWAWGFFVFCSLLAFYLLLGYPLLLWKWPFQKTPVHKDLKQIPTVSILLAVHNGAAFLRAKLDSILSLDYPATQMQILVLSDGSTDDTDAIALEYAPRGIQLLRLPRGGKAEALNQGLLVATGEILFLTDVRQKLQFHALRHLVANFADPKVGAVTGELRITTSGEAQGEQAAMDLYWQYELWARRKQSDCFSLFNTTGCLYAMRRSLAQPIPANTLIDDAELPLQAYLAGYRIVFDPASIAYDFPVAQGTDWTRRMRTLGGMWQVLGRHPRLLFLPHRMWLHFVSHKFGRLLLPYALIGIAVATFFLPDGSAKSFFVWNEAAFLLLALLPGGSNGKWFLGSYATKARTFLMMNLAALFSAKVFFVNPQRMWLTTKVDQSSGQI